MLLSVYPENSVSFEGNGELLHHTFDEVVERNEGFFVEFKMTLEGDEHKLITNESIIGAMTPDGFNYFRVFKIIKNIGFIHVTALHLVYDLRYKEVDAFSMDDVNLITIIDKFKQSFKTGYSPFTISTNITDRHDFSTNTDDENPELSYNALEVLNRIANRWKCKLLLNGFDIRLVPSLGRKTNALLYEHKNISAFEEGIDIEELVTRVHAYSTFTLERPEGSEEEPKEMRIYAKIDSPIASSYTQYYEKTYENNDLRTPEELVEWVMNMFKYDNIDKPRRTIKIDTNIIDDTVINYGDQLVLKYTAHDIDEIIEMVGYQYNPVGERFTSVSLGTLERTFVNVIADSTRSDYKKQIQKEVNQQIAIMAANSINRMVTGPVPMDNPINGDIWFYHPEGRPKEIETRIFENGMWTDDIFGRTKIITEIVDEMKKQDDELNSRIDAINKDIVDDIDDLRDRIRQNTDSDTVAKIIGNDKHMHYSDNRIPTEIDTSKDVIITYEDGRLCFSHNGSGFQPGKTYTLSFIHEFIERSRFSIHFNERTPGMVYHIRIRPAKPEFKTYDFLTSDMVTVNDVLKDTYSVEVTNSSGYYQRFVFNLDSNKNLLLESHSDGVDVSHELTPSGVKTRFDQNEQYMLSGIVKDYKKIRIGG